MACDKCNNQPYSIESVMNVDIDDLATPPDYFFGVRVITDPSTGAKFGTPVRVPGAKVMPTGNMANVTAIDTNNPALEIPKGQVRAGYIDTQPGGNVIRLADETHAALFLMLGEYTNGRMLIQTTGFLTINEGHQYLVGVQYYLGTAGEPVTDATVTGQKLFIPLDEYTLNVNGEF